MHFGIAFPLTALLSFYIMDIPLQRNGKSALFFLLFRVDPVSKAGLSFRAFLNTKAINALNIESIAHNMSEVGEKNQSYECNKNVYTRIT